MAADAQSKVKRPQPAVEPVRSEGEDPQTGTDGEALFLSVPVTDADWQHLQDAYDRSVESFE